MGVDRAPARIGYSQNGSMDEQRRARGRKYLLRPVLFPSAAVGIAILADERGVGLLNAFPVPYPVAMILSLLALDLMMYLMHLMFHAVPAFWRVHRVHHADIDFDLTTGVRFHPIQIVLSVPIKFAVIFVLGPPVLAVLLFEAAFNAVLVFSHANIRIPTAVDRVLRWFIVTPDMHRLHHSVDATETNSNFGFALTWWDRLFGTYRAEPAAGHEGMTIGVDQFRARRDSWLDRLLLQPFRDDFGSYAINRRWGTGEYSASAGSSPAESRQVPKVPHGSSSGRGEVWPASPHGQQPFASYYHGGSHGGGDDCNAHVAPSRTKTAE
jgi:sterol desaturase/sphingolipid hydroxylase (fatty acid hydroxylase superfamily)